MPSGYGQRHVRLPRLLPYLGQVKEGGERGEASDGEKPVRTGAGDGKRVVPTQSASILARSACPSVPDDARPLCLLRHIGQLSTHTVVRLPSRDAVEEMAGATASRRRCVPVDPPRRDPQTPCLGQDFEGAHPQRHGAPGIVFGRIRSARHLGGSVRPIFRAASGCGSFRP